MNERARSKRLRWAGPVFVAVVLGLWLHAPIAGFFQKLLQPELPTYPPYAFRVDGPSRSCEISPDARYIMTLSGDRMTFWDPFSRRPAADLTVDTPIHFAKFTPDGKELVVRSSHRYKCISTGTWMVRDTTIHGAAETIFPEEDDMAISYGAEQITGLLNAISARQKSALWASKDIRILDVDWLNRRLLAFDPLTQHLIIRANDNERQVPCKRMPHLPTISHNGRTAAWFESSECVVYDMIAGRRITFQRPRDASRIALNADSSLLALARNHEITLYDLQEFKPVATLKSELYIHERIVFAGDYMIAISGTTPHIEMWKIPGI